MKIVSKVHCCRKRKKGLARRHWAGLAGIAGQLGESGGMGSEYFH